LETSPEISSTGEGAGLLNLGEIDEKASVASLLGLKAELEAKISRGIRSGGDEAELTEAELLLETKGIHHEIFYQIENFLTENEMMGYSRNDGKPFVKISGNVEIIHYDNFIEKIENWAKITKEFTKITNIPIDHIPNNLEIASMFKRFYSGRFQIFLKNDEETATSTLDTIHLTTSIEHILANYGRQTRTKMTLFGILIPENEKREIVTDVQNMTDAVLNMNTGLENLEDAFRVKADSRIFPLGLYLEMF
jgi:hypothetical protein